ncbi:MAG: GSCFA domain-containing protein [Prevotellaceae bacterium]|jgi:hypothetical protein|nr:GSCFA domain-containing protein [Prevotellaceae bacterium]
MTKVNMAPWSRKVGYAKKTLLVGSCFASNIGEWMQRLKFAAMSNPFGVLYNPVSVAQSLQRMAEKRLLTAADLQQENNLWFSYTHDSHFSNPDKAECLRLLNESILKGAWGLKTADFLMVTLGTAWVYKLKRTGEVVANCHKTPAREFDRVLLSLAEIAQVLCEMLKSVQTINPNLQVVFTVSPVRHWKDGAHGNQLSKAALLLGVEEAVQKTENAGYFPVYEIVMDELRDYRFYADDMLHPSPLAIKTIWEKLVKVAVDEQSQCLFSELEQLRAAIHHRPANSKSADYITFLERQNQRLQMLKLRLPLADWDEEEAFFAEKL